MALQRIRHSYASFSVLPTDVAVSLLQSFISCRTASEPPAAAFKVFHDLLSDHLSNLIFHPRLTPPTTYTSITKLPEF